MKQIHDYLSLSGAFTNDFTSDFEDITMIIISNNNTRNTRVYSKNCHEKNGGKEAPKPTHNNSTNGPLKINKDSVEKTNPLLIADLLPFFIERQIFNANKLKVIQKRNINRSTEKHGSPISGFGSVSEKEICRKIRTITESIESRKNIPLNDNHNRSNAIIPFGFSSIFYFLYEKYRFININFFGRLSVIETLW